MPYKPPEAGMLDTIWSEPQKSREQAAVTAATVEQHLLFFFKSHFRQMVQDGLSSCITYRNPHIHCTQPA
jgi:hypothetical protein